MAAVPFQLNGVTARRDKSEPPYPTTTVGYASIPGLNVGGGPIYPDKPPVTLPPDWEIWPGPGDPDFPGLPDPIFPPDNPPAVIPTPHLGWNFYKNPNPAGESGWYYVFVPGAGQATPKTP